MANEQPNKDMQEQFEKLREAISSDLDAKLTVKFDEASRRLREELSKDIDKKLDEKFAGAEKRLADHVSRKFDTATKDLKGQMKVHFEDMQGLVKGAADGYGGTLESIERRLNELATKWDTKISSHDLALQNHAGRLEKLERR